MQDHFTLIGMWGQMGWIGKGVVVVLAIMSVYSLGLSIERAWRFHKARKQSLEVAMRVTPLLESHRIDDAISLMRHKDYNNSHIGRVLGAGLHKYQKDRGRSAEELDVVESSRRAIDREALMTTADMKKGLSNLATISTTAPFIGLFGTVIGIITAFRGMAVAGSGGLGAVSAGIAEALSATALGLFVAIPAVWLYNYFLAKIERFQVEMTNASSELVDYFVETEGRNQSLAGTRSSS